MRRRIVWIHGWGMSPEVWGEPAAELPGCSHRFFSYEGCGTMEEIKRKLAAELQPQRDVATTVVGWSLGGMLALEELLLPSRSDSCVESLAIVAGTLRFADKDKSRGWPPRIVERMRSRLRDEPEATLREFRDACFGASERQQPQHGGRAAWLGGIDCDWSREVLDAGLAYLLEADLTELWATCSRERGDDEVAGHGVGAMTPRLLWLHGAEDAICPPGAVPPMPPGNCVRFPAAGHMPFLTQREQFYDTLRGYIGAGDDGRDD